MGREYFKKKEKNKDSEKLKVFKVLCKKHGADYFEPDESDSIGVWKCPEVDVGDKQTAIAIAVDYSNNVKLGVIDEECDNFEKESLSLYPQETEWLANTMPLLLKVIKENIYKAEKEELTKEIEKLEKKRFFF